MDTNAELFDTSTETESPGSIAYKNLRPDLEGFTEINVKRGFTEIKPLFETISSYNAFICGGYVRYMISPNAKPIPARDVDIYSNDEDVYNNLRETMERHSLEIQHENDVSVTFFKPQSGIFQYCPTIQLIKPKIEARMITIGRMEDVISNFDFSVVRCALRNPTTAICDNNFIEDEKRFELRLKNIHCPISSMFRVIKYAKKGYHIKPMESLKLFFDWDNRDDEYKEKIINYLTKANDGSGLTETEIEELEALMRID